MNPRVSSWSAPSLRLRLLSATPLGVTLVVTAATAQQPAPAVPGKAGAEKTFTVNFRNTPWSEVLDWYAEQSGLTFVSAARPAGRLTIQPMAGRKFRLAEVTDLLNETLAPQKFILVRYEQSFTVWPADERIDPTRLPRVEESELPRRGRTEPVLCNVGPFRGTTAKQAMPQVEKMLSPLGRAILLNTTDGIQITDTAGNIDRILRTLPPRVPPAAKQ
jgi:type II secretory pathway component GspD/PulD (secretin)